MNTNRIKLFVIAIMILPILLITVMNLNVTTVRAISNDDEATVKLYKTKCAACHKATAEKFYDPEMPMEEQVEAILKGKKGEKPPYMPAYEDKGITCEQATALAEYMKALRTPETE